MSKNILIYVDKDLYINNGINNYSRLETNKNVFLDECDNFHNALMSKQNFAFKEISSTLDLFEIIDIHKEDTDLIVLAKINSQTGEFFDVFDLKNNKTSSNKFIPTFYEIVKITIECNDSIDSYNITDIDIIEIDTNYEVYSIDFGNIPVEEARQIFKKKKAAKMLYNLLGEDNIIKTEFTDMEMTLYHNINNANVKEYFFNDLKVVSKYYFASDDVLISYEDTDFENMFKVSIVKK